MNLNQTIEAARNVMRFRHMAATEKHLKDMQSIAFALLKQGGAPVG